LIQELKNKNAPKEPSSSADPKSGDSGGAPSKSNQDVLDRLNHLEQQLTEMNDRLRRIESSLPGSKSD
jgi:hypothetical protein